MNSTVAREIKVGVLDKAMRILQAFSGGDVILTPQDIARHTGLPLSTVYRLAQEMNEHGWLMKEGQRFRLGMTLLRLGVMVAEGIDIRLRTLPHLRWLKEQTSENSELYIRVKESRVAIEAVRGPHNLSTFVEIGAPLPLHVGAGGKVLLAWQPDEEKNELIAASAARYSAYPLTDMHALKNTLAHIHERGWAVSEGERVADIGAIAAPIFDVHKQMAGAMVLAAPLVRLGAKEQSRYIPLVCEAARRASHDMGYSERE